MTDQLAALAAGVLVVAGIWAVIRGCVRHPAPTPKPARHAPVELWARITHRPPGVRGRRRDLILLVSTLAGFGIAVLSGWLVAIVLVPLLALGLPYLLSLPRPHDVELLEALDRWIRALSATLGTGRSITDAIRISRRTAPPLIADEIDILVTRLNNRWETRDALMRFADAIDSPDADGVIAALILAAQRGANGASVTLQALADSIQAQLKGRRAIQVERAKPYAVVRQVTVISLGTLVAVSAMSPGFFAPYATPLGQGLLIILLLLYFGALFALRRRATQRPRARILVGTSR